MLPLDKLAPFLPNDLQHPLALGPGIELTGSDSSPWVVAEDLETLETRAHDAVVWRVEAVDAQGIHRLREVLQPTARLLAAVQGQPKGAEGVEGQQGLLAAGGESLLRATIRHLSENGFAIQRQRTLDLGDGRPPWNLLLCRPDDFLLRAYEKGDEAAILDLFPHCFFVSRSLAHWNWKYRDNPWGRNHISLALAPDSGALAAHYAGYPMPFYFRPPGEKGRRLLALQMGDTMTHPEHRGVGRGPGGLLARTVRHFFSLHRGDRFGFFYGFNTGPIQRFCNWFIGGSRVEPVCFRSRGVEMPRDIPGGYRVERVTAVGGAWDRLFRRVAPHYGFLAERSARYLTWRYLQCPDPGFVVLAVRRWGRLVGWGVFRRRESCLLWGDALFRPRHRQAAATLLAAALELPEHRGVETVEAWFPERPQWWHETLEILGFENQPHPDALSLMALPDTETRAVDHLQDLYYTLGDSDLF